ncbi:MAG: hypothetical protein ACR2G3_10405 [Solirubrobacterales bacterium]
MKRATATVIFAGALALAGCGGDDEGSEGAEATATPQEAIEQIAEVRAGLTDALASYAQNDAEAAAETVNETYLQHFEVVEGPLEEADEELNEGLEDQIREELVSEIEAGAPRAEVSTLVARIEKGLAEAEGVLGSDAPPGGSS